LWWISTCKGFYGDNAPFLWLKCNILVTFEIVRPRPSFWCAICWDCVKFEKRCGYPCGKIKVAWNPNMWHIKIIVLNCWMQPSDKKFKILKYLCWISTCKGFFGDNATFLWLKWNILVTFEMVRPRPSFWCAICWDCIKFEKRCGYPCGKIKVAWNPNMWHIKIIVLNCWMQL